MPKDEKKPEPKKDRKPAAAAAATAKVALECPRCGVTLGSTKYEGMAVDFCDACWGYWIGLHQFEAILAAKDEVFSTEEKGVSSGAKAHPADGKPLPCCRCKKGMAKLPIEEKGHVAFFLDYCRDHGLWL